MEFNRFDLISEIVTLESMNLRKASATLALACLSLASAYAQTSTLTGHIEGIGKQPITFWYSVNGEGQRDTVYATNDQFTYRPQPSDDGTISLLIKAPFFTYFWYEPGKITITGNFKDPYRLTFDGTPENEILNEYRQEIDWKDFDKKQEAKALLQFVKDHSASRTAVYSVYNTLLGAEEYNEIYQEIWNTLSHVMQASQYGKKAAQKIEALETQPVVGRVALDFTIPDTAGIDVSLADFKGKYVLIDFWGHWCGPCIKSFPIVKAIHEKYGDKLALIGIALEKEGDKENWLNAIHKYEANWTQLSDLNGEASETIRQYNINGYPTYILLDKEGVVLERSFGLEAIEKKLKEVEAL